MCRCTSLPGGGAVTPNALGELAPSIPPLTCSRWSHYLESLPQLLHLPTSTVHQNPQLSCPSPGGPQLLSPPAGRADCGLLGPPQLPPDPLLTLSKSKQQFHLLGFPAGLQALWGCSCARGATQHSKGTGFGMENLDASFHRI